MIKWIIYAVFAVAFTVSSWYTINTYMTCEGTVMRPLFNPFVLECVK